MWCGGVVVLCGGVVVWYGMVWVFLTHNNTTPTKLFCIVLLVGLWQYYYITILLLSPEEDKVLEAINLVRENFGHFQGHTENI